MGRVVPSSFGQGARSAVPLVIVGAGMLGYNAARFGDPLEFGLRYQLTSVDMEGKRVCGVRNVAEVIRLANNVLHYVFLPPVARSTFPFLDAPSATLDPAVTWPSNATEQVIGLAPLMPLTMIGTALALLFAFAWRGAADAHVRASIIVMGGAWIILAGLSTCWWIVARYSLEFMMLMAGATIVLIEHGLALLPRTLVPRLFVAALALYSAAAGFLLGFSGPGGAFKNTNPALIRRLTAKQSAPIRNLSASPIFNDGQTDWSALPSASGSAEVVRHNLAERKKDGPDSRGRKISLSVLSDSHQFADDLRWPRSSRSCRFSVVGCLLPDNRQPTTSFTA